MQLVFVKHQKLIKMKRKLFIWFTSVIAIAIATFNANLALQASEADLPKITLATYGMDGEIDDEVGGGDFDGGELPEVSITCDTGGSGTCYYYDVEPIDFTYCKTTCEESGNPDDYCSSFIIGLIELCELLF